MLKKTSFISPLIISVIASLIWANLNVTTLSQTNLPVTFGNLSISSLGMLTQDIEFGDFRWLAGTPLSEILNLGSFEDTDLPNQILGFIFDQTDIIPEEISLDLLPFLEDFNITELASFIPGLESLTLNTVPVLSALVTQQLGNGVLNRLGNQSIGTLINRSRVGSLILGNLNNLNSFSVTSLPGLSNTAISRIPGWRSLNISQIPGLDRLPFAAFAQIPTEIPLAILDVAYGSQEAYRLNSVSGSYQAGFQVPCERSSCIHIELGPPLRGKHWISGQSQWVMGGTGCLTGIEPTGRNPLGPFAKVVIINTNEANGTVLFALYFKFSIFCGTSPYIIGPFPFYEAREKDLVIIGL